MYIHLVPAEKDARYQCTRSAKTRAKNRVYEHLGVETTARGKRARDKAIYGAGRTKRSARIQRVRSRYKTCPRERRRLRDVLKTAEWPAGCPVVAIRNERIRLREFCARKTRGS